MPTRPQVFPAALLACTGAAAGQAGHAAEGYVPDRQCATCHRAIYESYQHVGMARSFYRPDPGNVIEDLAAGSNHFHHAPSGDHYEIELRDGDYFFRRYQLDAAGLPIDLFERRIDWIIGSGAHSRGYLYQTPSGELFQLPVVWYTQARQWGMAPGYDRPDHDGVTRPITRDCMFCHNAYPQAPAGSDAWGMPQVFPRDLPEGTGCQRCHGPGAEHIRLANDLDVPQEMVLASIVNPSRLPPQRRDDVCFQCHLQPTSKRSSLVRTLGRDDWSFRPGQDLAEYLVPLDFDDGRPRSQRFEINHHPYRLRQSRCFLESGDKLNCLTCHDPHGKVPPEQAAAHYRDRCLTCHKPDDCQKEPGAAAAHDVQPDDCVACHMPKRRTQDVVHVVMTDHLITRKVDGDPQAMLSETPSPQEARTGLYWPDRAPPEPAASMYRALSTTADGDRRAMFALEALLAEAAPAEPRPYIELAEAQLRAGRHEAALKTLESLPQPPGPGALTNIGVAYAGLGRFEEAAAALRQALQLDPYLPDALFNLGLMLTRLGNDESAQGFYVLATQLRPNHAKAWLNLGNLHSRAERYRDAADAYRQATSIDPGFAAAYRNLGAALRRLDDWTEAMRIWRHGWSRCPEHWPIALDLAMAYLTAPDPALRDPAAAIPLAEAAARIAPTAPQPVEVLALALLDQGRPEEAARAGERAAALGSDRATVLLIQALAAHAAGRGDEARATWREVSAAIAAGPAGSRVRETLLRRAEEVLAPPAP